MISENNEKILREIRILDSSLLNDSEALGVVFAEYIKCREYKDIERDLKISLAIQKDLEKKINRLMDAVNTILINSNIEECIPAAYMESSVFKKSRKYEKEVLAKIKQRKDNRNMKRKEPRLLVEK